MRCIPAPLLEKALKRNLKGLFRKRENVGESASAVYRISDYIDKRVGIVESLVIRMAPDVPKELLSENPLFVLTDDYLELPVDKHAFKAFKDNIPNVPCLKPVDNMRARETRKLFTYNLAHAVLSYIGATRGYKSLTEALSDGEVRFFAEKALEEVSFGLSGEFGFLRKRDERVGQDRF